MKRSVDIGKTPISQNVSRNLIMMFSFVSVTIGNVAWMLKKRKNITRKMDMKNEISDTPSESAVRKTTQEVICGDSIAGQSNPLL